MSSTKRGELIIGSWELKGYNYLLLNGARRRFRDFGLSVFLNPPKYLKKHNEVPHFTHTTKFTGCKK